MKQYWILFILGMLVFFFPFLGFPPAWEAAFLFAAGFIISFISISFLIKKRDANREQASARDS